MTAVEVDVVVVVAEDAVAIVADIAVTTVVVIVVVMIAENPIPDEAAMDGNIRYKNHELNLFLETDMMTDAVDMVKTGSKVKTHKNYLFLYLPFRL